jgi:deoxyhypusine synthase
MDLRTFIEHHFRHFNAAVVLEAAQAWERLLDQGGSMLLTLGGAMSTAEMGISIASLIRRGKVHGICTTGANLEEDIFNLVAHEHYIRIPNYRDLTPTQEHNLCRAGLNRVTDTCIPETEAMRRIEQKLLPVWQEATKEGVWKFPHEYLYQLILSGALEKDYQIDPKDSWMVAAAYMDLPIWTPGWEDSTLGNILVAESIKERVDPGIIKGGLYAMDNLVEWYKTASKTGPIGFFQIGGGISGDFPICAVPLIEQDLGQEVSKWGYFCQISDSTTSYGSYSGAVPNEKITWGKLSSDTPRFVIESDATIVFPLVAGYVLGL